METGNAQRNVWRGSMKRPEKKVCTMYEGKKLGIRESVMLGYNEALSDMNTYLPTVDEILSMLPPQESTPLNMRFYAKAIHKRITE